MKTNYATDSLRNRHFMAACRQVLREPGAMTAAMVAERAAALPAPAYYVTYDYALRRLRAMNRHGTPATDSKVASRLWIELRHRVDTLCSRHGIKDSEALARVLAQGRASSFFLAPASALRLYHALRSKSRRRPLSL